MPACGSRVIFSASGVREIVPAPSNQPVKPACIKQFLALIEAAGEVGKNEKNGKSES